MKIELNIKNIISEKENEYYVAVLYYSSDYDSFNILVISKLDDVSIVCVNESIDNKYYTTKMYALTKFNKICEEYFDE